MKFIDVWWFTGQTTVGLVVGQDEITQEMKAYIGSVQGFNEKNDIEWISNWGTPVSVQQLESIVKLMKYGGK